MNFMKKQLNLILAATLLLTISSCEKDDEPKNKIATLGAQENTESGGYYSVSMNKVFTQSIAFSNQTAIDILCFYEAESGNNIALASPGSGINGIFTGDSAPENWTTLNTTFFLNTTLTAAQFDALAETDQIIVSSFNEVDSRRKAKDMQPGLVVAFKTEDGTYGLLKVIEVAQGAAGQVKFEIKIKE
jgi:hypothetical protein